MISALAFPRPTNHTHLRTIFFLFQSLNGAHMIPGRRRCLPPPRPKPFTLHRHRALRAASLRRKAGHRWGVIAGCALMASGHKGMASALEDASFRSSSLKNKKSAVTLSFSLSSSTDINICITLYHTNSATSSRLIQYLPPYTPTSTFFSHHADL
jgi:hypothetical protein